MKLVSPEDCRECQYCCQFKRSNIDLAPIFDKEHMEAVHALYPDVKFIERPDGSFSPDIRDRYPDDDDGTFEAPCSFNDGRGCILSEDQKPFVCWLWPLRIMKHENGKGITLVLTRTCPAVSSLSVKEIREGLMSDGEIFRIWDYVSSHPEVIEEFEEGNEVIYEH